MKKKNAILAAVLNFFFMGPGYIYLGKKIWLGVIFTLGAIGLTFVELQIKEINALLYGVMFASVFIINTAFAIDAYQMARKD